MKTKQSVLVVLFLLILGSLLGVGCDRDARSPFSLDETTEESRFTPAPVSTVTTDALAEQTMEFALGVLDDLMSGDPARGDRALAIIESYDPGFYQNLINALAAAAGNDHVGAVSLELSLPESLDLQSGGDHTVKITITGSVTIKKNSWFSVGGVITEFLDDASVRFEKEFVFEFDCGEGVEISSRTRTTKSFEDREFTWGNKQNGGSITVTGKLTITVEVGSCEGKAGGVTPVDPGDGDRLSLVTGKSSDVPVLVADVEAQFFGIFEDLFSGNGDLQLAALEELWALDPYIYPSMLESLLPSADEEGQAIIRQLIADYWNAQGDFTRQDPVQGLDWCFIFKVMGTVRIRGTLVIDPPFLDPYTIKIDETFQVNWASKDDCGNCVLKTRTTKPVVLDGIPFSPPSVPIPYSLGTTAELDLKIDVNLKLVAEGYQCDPPKEIEAAGTER